MTIKISTIQGRSGTLYADLYENASAGIPRNLFWNIYLPCKPISWAGENWDCSIQCEWMRWSARDWTDLDGASLHTCADPASVECTIYIADHHPVRLNALSLMRVEGTSRFEVALSGTFDLDGYGDLDTQSSPLNLRGEVTFDGVVLVPDNFFPKPSDPSEVIRLVEPFLNVSALSEPQWDRFRYVLSAESIEGWPSV